MPNKSYSPVENAGDNLAVDFVVPNTKTGGDMVSVNSFPYVTDDAQEQAVLDNHPLLEGKEVNDSPADNTPVKNRKGDK